MVRSLALALAALLLGCQVPEPAAPPRAASGQELAALAASPGEPDRRFSVIAVGDVMLDKVARSVIDREGIGYPFARVRDVLEAHDVAFANLEAPISDRGTERTGKAYRLRVDPAHARALTRSGLDVVSLANNHMMDFGDAALGDTIERLDAWGIAHAGAGADLGTARAPARLEASGTEIVVLAYCAWAPAPIHAREARPGVAPMLRDVVLEDVRAYKREDNVVLVSLHWGIQHTDRATRGQRRLAREIIDAGADAILGHHPHRPQEVEVHRGRPIAYSLGNFVFGYYNKLYRDNVALVLEFEGARLAAARILPVAGRNGRIRFQPSFLEGEEGLGVLGRLSALSARLGTRLQVEDGSAAVDLGRP